MLLFVRKHIDKGIQSEQTRNMSTAITTRSKGLYLLLLSVHGLLRGHDMELGRDADTGGQVLYVVELARALSQLPLVGRVDLLTRRVEDKGISRDYRKDVEELGHGARIIRLDAGPKGYIRKEELWDHLDAFADNAIHYLHDIDRVPDIIHSHYADAGYIGNRLSSHFGVPLIHTGHSLGRVKRRSLLAAGSSPGEIESQYNMARRINAEETTLAAAELVIASTHNEIDDQYGRYDHYRPEQMRVIPPGTDMQRFHPPASAEEQTNIVSEINRFLREPDKPMILALSRADERKNIATLIEAYGESAQLQSLANLIIIAGNRDDIREMDSGPQSVLKDILLLVDQYDLYGRIAYPKHHAVDEVPVIYRLAAAGHGIFVNPALTEPFGLTLLEAAASGLPIVATEDGGPQDIIGTCQNGILIDPLDKDAMTQALLKLLQDPVLWEQYSENGQRGVKDHYSWDAHAKKYYQTLQPILERHEPSPRIPVARRPMLYHDRALFTDLDQNLLGDKQALASLVQFIKQNRNHVSFGIATGRRLESALSVMKQYRIPVPDVLITSVGTEIYYAPQLSADLSWSRHIDYMWNSKEVRRVLAELPAIKLQPKKELSRFKLSYYIDPGKSPSLEEIQSLLHQADQNVNLILAFGQFLDIIPIRASKGQALRYFASRWDIPLDHILTAGGSGADEDMMRGNTLAVVVANRHDEELSQLIETDQIYFAQKPYAAGIVEAIHYFDFLDTCRIPSGTTQGAG